MTVSTTRPQLVAHRQRIVVWLPLGAALVAAGWAVVVGSAHPGQAYSGAIIIGLGLAAAGRWCTDDGRQDWGSLRDRVRAALGADESGFAVPDEWSDEAAADLEWSDWLQGVDEEAERSPAVWVHDTARQSFDFTPWVEHRRSVAASSTPDAGAVESDPAEFVTDGSWPEPPWHGSRPVTAEPEAHAV